MIRTPPPPDPDENGARSPGHLAVAPETLECTPHCEGPVTIRNTGETQFVIEEIAVDGEDAESFSHSESCVGVALGEGDACEVTVTFRPNGTDGEAKAILLIDEDLTEDSAKVGLTGLGPPRAIDLAASDVRCTYEAADTEDGDGSLTVAFSVTVTGTDESTEVPIRVSSNSGASGTTTVFMGEGTEETVQTLSVGGEDSGADHTVKINLDPADRIPEADESNNDAQANCAA